MIIKENNNKRKFIKERTKGDYVPDRKDIFDDEDSITEARELHTWSITYNGKGNKAKTHMVDAPDAYEANRKARRELGISYNDIEDVTMVENKEMNESIENYNKYKLVDYFDVWGNEEEGYEVNNLAVIADDIVMSDDRTNQEILDFLVDIGYLVTNDLNKIEVVDDGDVIEFFEIETGCPIGRLERIWY